VNFAGEDLDPRYQYVTCLREPLDRALSWLHFVANNHRNEDLPLLREAVMDLLSDPARWTPLPQDRLSNERNAYRRHVGNHIGNQCVRHFAAIGAGETLTDETLLARAEAALARYDVWGLHEELPSFIADFSSLLGVEPVSEIARVNETVARPSVREASAVLRDKLIELNPLDLRFYEMLKARYAEARQGWRGNARPAAAWKPLQRVRAAQMRHFEDTFTLVNWGSGTEGPCAPGERYAFWLEFSLTREFRDLVLAVELAASDGRILVHTDTRELGIGATFAAGTHRLDAAIEMPAFTDRYSVNVIAAVPRGQREERVARIDALMDVSVTGIPATLALQSVDMVIRERVSDGRGWMRSDASFGDVAVGETFEMPVRVGNESSQNWRTLLHAMVSLACRWRDKEGNYVMLSGPRTWLDEPWLDRGMQLEAGFVIRAPEVPGTFILVGTVIQERIRWFEDAGFDALEREVKVIGNREPRTFAANDCRIASANGRVEGASLVSHGCAGFLAQGLSLHAGAGSWVATFTGYFASGGAPIRATACAGDESEPFAAVEVREDARSIELPFELREDERGLDLRLWVGENAFAQLDAIELRPVGGG
jgi:hypothetical protein